MKDTVKALWGNHKAQDSSEKKANQQISITSFESKNDGIVFAARSQCRTTHKRKDC